MADTSDRSIGQTLASAQKWASDVAGEAWQPIQNHPWAAGIATAGAIGLGFVFRAPILRAVSALATKAPEVAELAPRRLLTHADTTVQATELNINRLSLLQDMDARARTPVDTYIKWLGERTKIREIDPNIVIARDGAHQVVIRKDMGLSFRRKDAALEIVDHEGQSARLYTNDYGSMRTTIYPSERPPGVRPNGPSFGRIKAEFLEDGGSEKSAYIRHWFRTAEGKSLLNQINSL